MHFFGLETIFDVEHLLSTYGYIGIFLIVFLESGIFFLLPGDSLLFTAGLFASVSGLSIFYLVPLVFIATFSGGIVGYHLGTYIERLHAYPFFRRILSPEHIAEAHRFFERHGRYAIIISRFVPLMRTFAPIAAGIAQMPRPLFVRYSFISSALWSLSITLLGYFLGVAVPEIKDYLSLVVIAIVVVSLLPVLWQWLLHRRQKRSRTR
jgi:membrane-associated protein